MQRKPDNKAKPINKPATKSSATYVTGGKKTTLANNKTPPSKIDTKKANTAAPKDERKTGLVWHEDMVKHAPEGWPETSHCENPTRLTSIIERLSKCSSFTEKDVELISDYPEADKTFVNEGHNKDTYYDYIKTVFDPEVNTKHADTYVNEHTTRAALLAANAVKVAVDKIYQEKTWKNAFLAIRPPGHHADGQDKGGFGFCHINNVVCGARYAQTQYKVPKICIFDWDVHHGDSSQILTYDDPSILYISFHRYDNGTMFPGPTGDVKNLGGEKALGFNLNLPWNIQWDKDHKMLGSEEYIYAFERLVVPILEEWKPDLTFISAGFDSCIGDNLGGIGVKPSCYAWLTDRLSKLTVEKRVIVALEGGYNFDMISQSSECVFRALREEKDPIKSVEKGSELTYKQLLLNSIPTFLNFTFIYKAQKEWEKHWPCIKDENISKQLKDTAKRAGRISELRNRVVGPNLTRFGHQEIDLDKKNFSKFAKASERDFYTQLTKSNELKDLKPLFPEILDINNLRVLMKDFVRSNPEMMTASLLKIDLKPFNTEIGFTFIETNVKDTEGMLEMFCPMADKQIWGDEDDLNMRVYEGFVKFFKNHERICTEDLYIYTKIISEELHKTIDVINKVTKTNPEFVKKKLFLNELSVVLLLNHDQDFWVDMEVRNIGSVKDKKNYESVRKYYRFS